MRNAIGKTVFAPITARIIGGIENWQTVYSLSYERYDRVKLASVAGWRSEGSDDFLIGELTEDGGTLVDVLDSEGQPLKNWGQESYRSVARGIGRAWEPKRGTRAEQAPEDDQ